MNKDTTFSIFLSYSWKDMKTADSIDNDFTQTGVKILRDVRDLGYKDSIRDFMRKINDTDYVILLISRAYLESPNCMYEVLELLKDPNYKKRILPIILEDANIFNSKGKIELIKFWENKTSELNAHTGSLDRITNVSSIIKDIEHFEKIRNSIDEFISVIIDLNCKTLKELKDNGYKAMLDLMGISNESIMAEMLFTTSIDDLEERDIAIHKLSTKYPKNINILLLKGMLALNKKQWKLAMTYFSDFIKNHANFPDAHNNLGIAYSNLKEYDKAIIEYETAISIDSKYYEAYTNLGSTYLEDLPDYEKSKKNSEKALELNSENGRAHYNYACLFDDDRDRFDQQKDIEKSIDHYLEAIRTSSSSKVDVEIICKAHFALGNLFQRIEDPETSRKHYELCIKFVPKHFQAHCNFAVLLRHFFKDYELSKDHYELALDINRWDALTHCNYGRLLWQNLEKYELADSHFKRAEQIESEFGDDYNEFKRQTGYR